MSVRVVQWATGAVGIAQLREVIDRPDLELVGVFVYSPDKVGVDAGTLVGRPPTGVARDRTTSRRSWRSTPTSCSTLRARRFPTTPTPTTSSRCSSRARTSSPRRRTTTCPTYGADADARIRAACERAGTRFHAAGEHPGFMFERLATSLTALSQRVDKITVQEFVDCSGVSGTEMLVDLMGMGKQPEDITDRRRRCSAPCPCSTSRRSAPPPTCSAWSSTRSATRSRPARRPTTSRSPAAPCPRAPSSGRSCRGPAYRDGAPVLVAEEYWTVTDIPGWDLDLERTFLVRVIVDGVPPLRVELTIGNDTVGELEGTSGGQLAVAMTAVRAIPDVLAGAARGRHPARVRRLPLADRVALTNSANRRRAQWPTAALWHARVTASTTSASTRRVRAPRRPPRRAASGRRRRGRCRRRRPRRERPRRASAVDHAGRDREVRAVVHREADHVDVLLQRDRRRPSSGVWRSPA